MYMLFFGICILVVVFCCCWGLFCLGGWVGGFGVFFLFVCYVGEEYFYLFDFVLLL